MTFQLNTVLGFENGGNWYVYWIQDVAWVDTSSQMVDEFENNIWNMSGASATMYSSSVSGNGQVYEYSSGEYYYAYGVGASFGYPGTFQLILNTTVNSNGHPEVWFMYDTGSGFVTYDLVTFPWVTQLDYSDDFIVDGGTTTPNGLYYDAEFVACGPGGGSNTINEGSSVQFYLQYWNGNNYQTISNGEDHGEDTGETITDTEVNGEYSPSSGELYATMTEGTENIDLIWVSSQVATVDIEGPASGKPVLDSESWGIPYTGGFGSITLWPVSSDFALHCDGFTEQLGSPVLSGGATVTLSAGTWTNLTFQESGLPSGTNWNVSIGSDLQSGSGSALNFYIPNGSYHYSVTGAPSYLPTPSRGDSVVGTSGGSVSVTWQLVKVDSNSATGSSDLGQTIQFSASLVGVTGDAFSWTGLPVGCVSSDSIAVSCKPTSPAEYQVKLTVVDANAYQATSAALVFAVYADPSVTAPLEAPPSTDVGQEVAFSTTSTPGSGGDTFAWADLPKGCASSDSNSLACVPEAPGTFTINVTVTDSDGISANSSSPFTVFAQPSIESISVSPGSTTLAGGSLTFSAVTTPGSGGLDYVWNGLPSGCQSVDFASFTCTPSAAGTWNVTLTVTDTNHGSATSVGTIVTIQPSFLGLPALEGYLLFIVGSIIAAIAIVLAVVVSRRGRKSAQRLPRIVSSGGGEEYGPAQLDPSYYACGPATPSGPTQAPPGGREAPVSPVRFEEAPSPQAGLDPGSVSMGTPLINPPEPTCWNCRFQNEPGSRYCAHCAVPLEPPATR